MSTKKKLDRRLIEQKTDSRCAYCGCELDEMWQVDHITAQSSGGGDSIDNLIASCPDCNVRKSDKSINGFRSWIKGRIIHRLRYLIDALWFMDRFSDSDMSSDIESMRVTLDRVQNSNISFFIDNTRRTGNDRD